MEEMIEVFGFGTNSGLLFEMHNTTTDAIKAEIHKRFPKWSAEAVEKIVANKSFYKAPVPFEQKVEKKKVKRGSIAKECICINGYELNPVLNLGQSIHVFHKHAYRSWGTITDKIFSNPNVSAKYEDFEKAYDGVVVAIKSVPRESKGVITSKVIAMCNQMDALKSALDNSGILNEDANEDYVKSNGRQLGIGELMQRVGELSDDCTKNLKK